MWWFFAFFKRGLKRQRGVAKKILSTVIEIHEKKIKKEKEGREEGGEERKNTDIDRLARLDGAHTYTRRFFPPSLPS